jgi:hypothetical protein
MQHRKEFYNTVDDEWAKFWVDNHVNAPNVRGKFVSHLEGALGLDDSETITDFTFLRMMRRKYPVANDYYNFKDFIRQYIVLFIEREINK